VTGASAAPVVQGGGYFGRTVSWPPGQRRSGAGPPENGQASTRDKPVNLSDSHLETHQHCSPAGATCCNRCYLIQMLRSPIELHKWPFLLVTRGEE
jgi:hypothetical protein